jgi:hypothetical protein
MSVSESPSYGLIAAEYTNLRAEIIKLVELQHQILIATLVAVGAFLTIGLQSSSKPSVLLAYPLVSLCLATQWSRDDFRIRQIASYLHRLELKHSELGWVAHLMKSNPRSFLHEGYVYSAVSMFLTAQILTFVISFTKGKFSSLECILAFADLACMIVTAGVLKLAEIDVKRGKAPLVSLSS